MSLTPGAHSPHWLVVYNPPDHHRKGFTALRAGEDLQAAIKRAIDWWTSDGWAVENDGRYGFFFVRRGAHRLEIRLQSHDPCEPVPLTNTQAKSKP
jgi:hypothetical protein